MSHLEVEIKEKGRIIIPSKIRKALGLREGDKMKLEVAGGILQLKPAQIVTIHDIYGIAKTKVKLKEIEDALGHE